MRNVVNVPSATTQKSTRDSQAENADSDKFKITYDFYKRVSNMLVLFLRGEQEAHEEESEWSGIKSSELANWLVPVDHIYVLFLGILKWLRRI